MMMLTMHGEAPPHNRHDEEEEGSKHVVAYVVRSSPSPCFSRRGTTKKASLSPVSVAGDLHKVTSF